jgi:multiple sugar transport system substrate-binding protein
MKFSRSFANLAIALLMIGSISLVSALRTAAIPVAAAGSVSWATWSSNPTEQAGQKKLLDAFQSKYGINVDFQVINGDYNAALKARLTAGTAPDVFYVNSDHVQDYIRTGALKNLDFLKKDKTFNYSSLYKNLQAGYTYKGHVYGIVKDYSPLALWYNKALFSAAGISKPPTTWAQMQTDACKLTDKSKKQYGLSLSADPARWLAFVYQAGGSLLNKKQTKATIDSSAAKTALTYYAGLVKKGCAARPDQVGAGWNGEAFGRQNAAMAIEGNWMTSYMQQTFPSVKYGIAVLPKGPKGAGNLAFTSCYAINAHTSNLKNATTFFKYVAGKAGTAVWSHVVDYLPARKDVKPPAGSKVFVAQVKSSHDWFFPPGFADRALGPIGDDIRKVMDGSMSVNDAVSDMQSQATKALTQAP